MNKAMILVVEDDSSVRNLITTTLKTHDYKYITAENGKNAIMEASSYNPDIVLLDLGLPDIDGVEVIHRIRAWSNMPIIVISARSEDSDKIQALDAGADDYLTKPFEIIELLARVETVLRRYHKTEQILTEGDLVIDTASHTVKKNGEPVGLTKKEYELLLLFVRNKNIALYRETIYERIWGGEYMGDSRTVDLHVQRMRRKVGWEDKIVTVYKVGYRLEG